MTILNNYKVSQLNTHQSGWLNWQLLYTFMKYLPGDCTSICFLIRENFLSSEIWTI